MNSFKNTFKRLALTLLAACAIAVPAYPELLIVKKEAGQFAPLSNDDTAKYGQVIADILLKYQWPMCTASELTPDEQDELLTPGHKHACAEEQFIQKKIRAETGQDFYVVFIPTTLYELFVIDMALQPKDLNNPLHYAIEQRIIERYEFRGDIDVEMLIHTPDISSTLKQYQPINNLFYQGPKFVFLHVNNRLATELFNTSKEFSECTDTYSLAQTIKYKVLNFADDLIEKIKRVSAYNLENYSPLTHPHIRLSEQPAYQSAKKLIENISKNALFIYTMIDLECMEKYNNKVLLVRGATYNKYRMSIDPLASPKHLAESTVGCKQDYWGKDTNGRSCCYELSLEDAYKQNKITPYSVSFGNSLLGGGLMDNSACVFNFLSGSSVYGKITPVGKSTGIAVRIDKKSYMQDNCDGLFFIAPTSTIAALFQNGEMFHSRTKAAVPTKTVGGKYRVRGIFGEDFEDKLNLFQIKRDPLLHAEYFANFLAENMLLIFTEYFPSLNAEERNFPKQIHDNHVEYANFCHDMRLKLEKEKLEEEQTWNQSWAKIADIAE